MDISYGPEQPNEELDGASMSRRVLNPEVVTQAAELMNRNQASQALALLSGLEGVDAAAPELRQNYYVELAWANYRNGSNKSAEGQAFYGAALRAAENAGEDPRALVCLASVLAQSDVHRNDQRLFTIAKDMDLPANPGILNSIVIRASKGGVDPQLIEEVHCLVRRLFDEQAVLQSQRAVFGHILQNYGKLHLQVLGDAATALKCFEGALLFYDINDKSALPHMGAAYFWAGQAHEALGNLVGRYAAETASEALKDTRRWRRIRHGCKGFAVSAKPLGDQERPPGTGIADVDGGRLSNTSLPLTMFASEGISAGEKTITIRGRGYRAH